MNIGGDNTVGGFPQLGASADHHVATAKYESRSPFVLVHDPSLARSFRIRTCRNGTAQQLSVI
jgi:hypothetical protein